MIYVYVSCRPFECVADAIGMTTNAVRLLVSRNKTFDSATDSPLETPPASSSNTPTPVFDNFAVGAIRRRIHTMFVSKQFFTIPTLADDLKKSNIIPEGTSEKAVWRIVHNMGFRYKMSKRKMYVRKESLDVVCCRIDVL